MFQSGGQPGRSQVPLVAYSMSYRAMILSQLSSFVVIAIVRGLAHAMLYPWHQDL